MTKKMHAAVVEQFGQPLVMKELAIPEPGAGQILVKTEACGVCHTDLHAVDGDWPLKPTPPFIPGHEAVGIVMALGAGVTAVKKASGSAYPGCIRRADTASIVSLPANRSAPMPNLAAILRTAGLSNISLPTRITLLTHQKICRLMMRRRSFAQA
jgi:D-arabinose 1-dehydrogenase-like Zn-dependent alcohol dehydrogenase